MKKHGKKKMPDLTGMCKETRELFDEKFLLIIGHLPNQKPGSNAPQQRVAMLGRKMANSMYIMKIFDYFD